ncbi:hypothetical protein ENH_00086430 [Eimeria necatrix]|uniref:Secreted protein n=1 Tax=Eimeria necatrix TaxID=51315 RepID=U6MXF3_9EIME|nr:hypothetical protein ENH_00086430 [Eimeria necatrix]CDJ68937.1 hypothetical protein ENH_00086430 [Eimeria necatrix]
MHWSATLGFLCRLYFSISCCSARKLTPSSMLRLTFIRTLMSLGIALSCSRSSKGECCTTSTS